MYCKTRDKTTKYEVNAVKKQVIDIIKKNSNNNIRELNRKIIDIFEMDEQFKLSILKNT